MIAAPQRSISHCPSPLSLCLFLGEQKAAAQDQTVPISPSLSPLAQHNKRRNCTTSLNVPNRETGSRQSPSPALVPDCGDRVFSGSPLLRQILTGHKRQREVSPDARSSPATPSPIATHSKKFCQHCSNVYSENNNSLVVLSRKKPSSSKKVAAKRLEQVVPNSSPPASSDGGGQAKKDAPMYKNGIKMFELFAGDDIFAHHEE